MNILWSPDLSLATPTLALMSPKIIRSLEGDDLNSYCVARLLANEVSVFKPGRLSAVGEHVAYDKDGVPILTAGDVDDDGGYLLSEFSYFLSRFGALQRIFEESPGAIRTLLFDPGSIPSPIVASYLGFFETLEEQQEVHEELVEFLRNLADALILPGPNAPLFFTGNALLGFLYLEAQPVLTPENTLSLLATSGLRIALPRVAALTEEGLASVHESLREERENYIEALNLTISTSYSALKSGDMAEAYRFAQFAISTKVNAEASKVERAARSLNKGMLKRLGIAIVEGLPSLARAAMSPAGVATEMGIQILSILTSTLGTEWKERQLSEQYPLGSYVYKVRRELDRLETTDVTG